MKHFAATIAALALLACTDERSGDEPRSESDKRGDARDEGSVGLGVGDEGANMECFPRTVCVDGRRPANWPDVCVSFSPSTISAAVYAVCVVDDQGVLGVLQLRGDQRVLNAGWMHSSYGNGNIASTLSSVEEGECAAALVNYREKPTTAPCPSAGD